MTNRIVPFDQLGYSKAFDLAVEGYSALVGWGDRPLAYPTPAERGMFMMANGEPVSILLYRADPENQCLNVTLIYTEQSSEGLGYATELLKKTMQVAKDRNLQKVNILCHSQNDRFASLLKTLGYGEIAKLYSHEIAS